MALVQGTKARALAEAKTLLQTYGFNGFSFQHVADALGIKKPSLYVHFKSKEELGQDLIEDYRLSFKQWTSTIELFSPVDKVGALFEMFFSFSTKDRKYCPLASLVGDFNSLPSGMQKALVKVFKVQQSWLEDVIKEGQKKKLFSREMSSEQAAQTILAMAFGSQQIARIIGQPDKIRAIKDEALKILARV